MVQARATALTTAAAATAAAATTTGGAGGAGGAAPPFRGIGEPAAGRERAPMDSTSSTFGAVGVCLLAGLLVGSASPLTSGAGGTR